MIATFVHHYGYIAVFFGSLIEGETALILGTLAVEKGYLRADYVLFAGFAGGFLGDQILFFLGRFYGDRLLRRFPRLVPAADRAKALLFRFRAPLIIVIRFLYGLRTIGPVVIGMADIPPLTFLLFNALGAVLWVLAITALAGTFSGALAWLLVHALVLQIVSLVLVAILAGVVYRRTRH